MKYRNWKIWSSWQKPGFVGFVAVDGGSWGSHRREGRRNNKAHLYWTEFTWVKLLNRLIIEYDSNCCSVVWLRTVRFDQFIAFMARYAFFSLFSMLKVTKKGWNSACRRVPKKPSTFIENWRVSDPGNHPYTGRLEWWGPDRHQSWAILFLWLLPRGLVGQR